jgi:hypothetical protein
VVWWRLWLHFAEEIPPVYLYARVENLPDALEINPAFYMNDVGEIL